MHSLRRHGTQYRCLLSITRPDLFRESPGEATSVTFSASRQSDLFVEPKPNSLKELQRRTVIL